MCTEILKLKYEKKNIILVEDGEKSVLLTVITADIYLFHGSSGNAAGEVNTRVVVLPFYFAQVLNS